MERAKNKNARRALSATALLAASFALQAPTAQAGPADKVYSPSVEQGEVELELRGGYQWWHNHDEDRARQAVFEVGYGLTSWWMSELGISVAGQPGTSTRVDEIEWENIFALTEPGKYWADLGLFVEFAHDRVEGRNAIEIGPLVQKEFGRVQANGNLFFERQLGSGAEPGAEIEYRWQVKWRGNPLFEPGLQGFGTLGRTNDFGHATEHKVGPAFFGQAPVGGHKLKYDAAVLFGLNSNTPDTTVRFTLEYEL
jgi:hypothetical protein